MEDQPSWQNSGQSDTQPQSLLGNVQDGELKVRLQVLVQPRQTSPPSGS